MNQFWGWCGFRLKTSGLTVYCSRPTAAQVIIGDRRTSGSASPSGRCLGRNQPPAPTNQALLRHITSISTRRSPDQVRAAKITARCDIRSSSPTASEPARCNSSPYRKTLSANISADLSPCALIIYDDLSAGRSPQSRCRCYCALPGRAITASVFWRYIPQLLERCHEMNDERNAGWQYLCSPNGSRRRPATCRPISRPTSSWSGGGEFSSRTKACSIRLRPAIIGLSVSRVGSAAQIP